MSANLLMDNWKNGKKIHDWITRNHAPMTWNLIAVKIGDHFLENEIDPFSIMHSTEFTTTLVSKIDQVLRMQYHIGLPKHLLN